MTLPGDAPSIESPTSLKDLRLLASVKNAGEVLEAHPWAKAAYDAEQPAKAQQAHAVVIAKCCEVQSGALANEATAHTRIADEYDAAHSHGCRRAGPGVERWICKEEMTS